MAKRKGSRGLRALLPHRFQRLSGLQLANAALGILIALTMVLSLVSPMLAVPPPPAAGREAAGTPFVVVTAVATATSTAAPSPALEATLAPAGTPEVENQPSPTATSETRQ